MNPSKTVASRGRACYERSVIREYAAGIAIHVGVKIDQAGGDVEPGNVDRLCGFVSRYVSGDAYDAVLLDRYVEDTVYIVARVDNVAALEQERRS